MKYKVVYDEPEQQSVAGKINDLMKIIEAPALREDIMPQQAINAWASCLLEEMANKKGHFGESLYETAAKRMSFWKKVRDYQLDKESALADWLKELNPFLLMSFLTAFWKTDLKTAKTRMVSFDLDLLKSAEGRTLAASFMFDTLNLKEKEEAR